MNNSSRNSGVVDEHRERLKNMTLAEAKAELSNAIYRAGAIIEDLEHAGKVHGNGHHARQHLCEAATKELESRWIEKPIEATKV